MGWTLNHLGRHEEALAALKQSIEIDSTNAVAWANCGRAKLGLGRTSEALDDLQSRDCIGRSPSESSSRRLLQRMFCWDVGTKPNEHSPICSELPPSPNPGAEFQYLPDLIATVFRTSTDRKVWAHRVARLVEIGADARKDRERTNG